jgi:hypothetical protein
MNRLRLNAALVIFLGTCAGCASGAYNVAALPEEAGSGYCHKKLRPVGSTDPARIAQNNSSDYIDYSGPCDGPSAAEQVRKQRRFEQFRFGRDYMDEG